MPRWPDEPPAVDPTGRSYLVVASGAAGRAVASGWAAAIEAAAKPLWLGQEDHEDAHRRLPLEEFAARLQTARIGTRVMVAGPELEVLDVLRVARAAGAIDAELRAHVTPGTGERRIHCPHCGVHTIASVAVGDTVQCDGCARTLIVYHHVSRLHGAYLGYMVDAEEPVA